MYLYAYSTFLEVMLLEILAKGTWTASNGAFGILVSVSFPYTECYTIMDGYSKSSIQTGMLGGLAAASKLMGETIAKVPGISRSQLDENLIKTGVEN